jgi:hypothetical protein
VHVNSTVNKVTVDTDHLNWSNARRHFYSDARVKVLDRGKGRLIQGVGFDSDESLHSYNIHGVSGRTFAPE